MTNNSAIDGKQVQGMGNNAFTLNLFRFDEDEFRFDPRAGRFRVVSGAGKGSFVSREAVLSQQRLFLNRQENELVKLGDRLIDGGLSVRAFEKQAGETLRRIHIASAIIGKGGRDRMTQNDWDKVTETIKRQLYKGRGENGKPYGIKHLMAEYKAGKVSPAQLRFRLKLYAQSGIVSYSVAEIDDAKKRGITMARRVLSPGAMHCSECIEYANRGWQEIGQIVPIGIACSCKNNCLCRIEMQESLTAL
jgi:hypothetical protein